MLTTTLPRNLKPWLQPNYENLISQGKEALSAKDQTDYLRSILNAISCFKYTEFNRYIQIKKELGESNTYLNTRIQSARQFAKFLQTQNYVVDIQLVNYPIFKV